MIDKQFWKSKKVLVTGAGGFLGSYITEALAWAGADVYANLLNKDTKNFLDSVIDDITIIYGDLTDNKFCRNIVMGKEIVIHLAAKVGGIGFNQEKPGELFYDNLIMGAQLMDAARLMKIKKFVAIGTVCAYPKMTKTPFKEKDLWLGYPEETNAPYGLAKKMMLVQGQAYRQQYDFNSIFLLPVNLYGPRDNFNPESSHVIPALIRKFQEAKEVGLEEVEVWGTGKASREFFYVEDCARAILMAAQDYDKPEPVNLGSGKEITIKDLVEKIKKIIGYEGKVKWNTSKPDGQPRRYLDVSKAKEEFKFEAKKDFDEGLEETIKWYKENKDE